MLTERNILLPLEAGNISKARLNFAVKQVIDYCYA